MTDLVPAWVVALAAVLTLTSRDAATWWAGLRARTRLGTEDLPPSGWPAPRWVSRRLEAAAVPEPERWWFRWVTTVVVLTAAAVVVPAARVALIAVAIGPPALVVAGGDRAATRRRRQLPDALDRIATGLRGGASLVAALAAASSIGPPLGLELTAIARSVDAGLPLRTAIERWSAGADDAHTALATGALAVAHEVGGPGARALDGAAASLRDRLAAEAEAGALATQGRASAAVLTLAPAGFAVLLTGVDARAGGFLLSTPAGWLCLGAGLGLDALGAWWMSRLVRRAR